MMRRFLVRIPAEALVRAATLTHLPRRTVDPEVLAAQHAAYRAALREDGCEVVELPPLPDHPDATFVEDMGVSFPRVFILGRSAAESRRGEAEATAAHLPPGAWRRLLSGPGSRAIQGIEGPATLDGGDVLPVGRTVLTGRSGRTDASGAAQLAAILEPMGYRVRTVPVVGALHLKTACTALDAETLLVNPAWVDVSALGGFRVLEVHPREPFAANVLPMPSALFMAASAPRTRERVEAAGYAARSLDISEFEKAEGGLTCLSLDVS